MDNYVIEIKVKATSNLSQVNGALLDVVVSLDHGNAVEVEAFYATQAANYDYLAIIAATTIGAARGAAAAFTINGLAKTSLTPAMTGEAYEETLINPLGIR